MEAYEEASRAFFFGRDEEADELFRLIRLAPLTVVYGKSGLGKTSLLQAGLYPKLREQHYLPVHVRLEFSDVVRDPPLQQVMRRLKEEMDREKAEYPEPRAESSLWEYLHRKDLKIWSYDNFPLTPVLVFDQFEELFSHRGNDLGLITNVVYSLADLIENRIPPEVINEEAGAVRSSLDLLSQRYRIVLSFREDFLPEVQTWEPKTPSLMKNYLRLNPMSRDRAIKAVTMAGKEVLDPGVAPRIVDLVGERDHAADATNMSEMVIEPVLLSLCCSRLNSRRAKDAKIDQALVEHTGQDILDGFYRDALADQAVQGPPDAALFIEDYLIQGDHFRGSFPKEEALDNKWLTETQLSALTDKHRLLRLVHHPDTTRVELIHDRLVPVVRKARDERKIKQHKEEQERLAREANADRDKERARSEELQRERDTARRSLGLARFMRNIAAGAGIVIVILVLLVSLGESQRAGEAQKRAEAKATEAQKKAEEAANTALSVGIERLAAGRQALRAGMEPFEELTYRGLGVYRLSQGDRGVSQARAASLTVLHSAMEVSGHLRKAVTIDGLIPTPALAYSPDGTTLAVGGEDGLVRLVNAETYGETDRLDCGQSADESVWTLAYNSDGTRLAAGYTKNGDGSPGRGLLCIFDVSKREVFRSWSGKELWGRPSDITSVAYRGTPGSEFVISAGSDKIVRLFDLKTGKVREFPHKQGVVAVAVSMDSRSVASGGEDGVVRLWNLSEAKAQPVELGTHEALVQQVVFSPTDPNLLVSGGDDGRIIVWNVKGQCRVQQSKQQSAKIVNLDVSPDGLIAAASADGYVRLYKLAENMTLCINPVRKGASSTAPKASELVVIQDGELSGHGGLVMGTAFNPEGSRLASTGQDGSIRIWGYKTPGFSLAQLELRPDAKQALPGPVNVTTLAISPDGESIAAGDDNGNIHLWNRPKEKGNPLMQSAAASWHAHDKTIHSLAFLRIGSRSVIVSGGDDGVVKRWEAVSHNVIGPHMADQAESVRSIALSPDGKMLVAGSSDGTIRLWDAESGKRVRRFEKPKDAQEDYELYAVGYSGDGKHLAVGDSYIGFRILEIARPESERLLQGHGHSIRSVSQGGGRWLLSVGEDGRILEWQQSALEQVPIGGLKKRDEFMFRLGVHDTRALTSIDTSRDGKLILVGGHQGRVELWDGNEHVQIAARFLGHESKDIRAVALAPDGKFFVTADASTVLVWPGPDEWADIICSKLGRNMSRGQWREWVSPVIEYYKQCPDLPIPPDAPAEHPTRSVTGGT